MLRNGCYDNEDTAARASDTLARKLMANGEQGHKLNFPDDDTDVFPEVTKHSTKSEVLQFLSERPTKRKRTNRKHLGHLKNN